MNENVVSLQEALPSRVHGYPYAEGSVIAADQFAPHPLAGRRVQPFPAGSAVAGRSPYPPRLWNAHGCQPSYAHARQLDQPTASATEPTAEPGTELVPVSRRARLPVPRRRTRSVGGAELVRRAERRARRRRRARKTGGWLGQRGWWVMRGLGVAGRGLWRIVWQPERSALIAAMKEINPDRAHTSRKELRRERRNGLLGLVVIGATGCGVAYFWGDDLLAWLPWWTYPVTVLVIVPSLAFAGRPEAGEDDQSEVSAGEMPASLTLESSDRGVAANLAEAFADIKIRATVNAGDVRREPGGWGWTVRASVLDSITEPRLEALERYLNTPVGGLVLSPESQAARVRYLRIVMADLLAEPIDAPERAVVSVRVPVELATRFDGGRLKLELFGRHMLIIGRTGSGKSGVLLDIVDALIHMPDVNVAGLDLTGGPDLRSVEASLRSYVGGPDYVGAEALLADAVALVRDRTARLGARNWDPARDGPGHVVVIDEYGMVADNPRLRALVEYVVTYGAKAGVWVILANQRAVNEMMRSSRVSSQVHVKIYLGMDPLDVQVLPRALREQGVRPHLFRQATRSEPYDAGKGFVIGVEQLPILVRFDRTDRAIAGRRALERAPHRPELCARDQEVLRRAESDGVPELLLLVREAIVATASEARRNPERASGEEISAYLRQRGRAIEKTALVRELRNASGGLIGKSRDTNLSPGRNPKGFYLEDLDQAISVLRERARQAADAQTTGGFHV